MRLGGHTALPSKKEEEKKEENTQANKTKWQGCETSDFILISEIFSLHKTPYSDF